MSAQLPDHQPTPDDSHNPHDPRAAPQEHDAPARSLFAASAGTLAGTGTGAVSLGIIGGIIGVVIGAIVGWDWYYTTFLADIFEAGQGSGVFLVYLIPAFIVTMLVFLAGGGLLGGLVGLLLGGLIGALAGGSLGWGISKLLGGGGVGAWLMVLGGGTVLAVLAGTALFIILMGYGFLSGGASDAPPTATPHEAALEREMPVPREPPRADARAYIASDDLFALNVPEVLTQTTAVQPEYAVAHFAHPRWPSYLFVLLRPAPVAETTADLDAELQAMVATLRDEVGVVAGDVCEPEDAESYYEGWQRRCQFRFTYEAGGRINEDAWGYIRQDHTSISMLILLGDRGLERRHLSDMLRSFQPDPTPALDEDE